MKELTVFENCQICSSLKLINVIDLGFIPNVNDFKFHEANGYVKSYRLNLVQCLDCKLIQLDSLVTPNIVFPTTYPYRSGTTNLLHKNFEDLEIKLNSYFKEKSRVKILDIGSNDGTLLSKFDKVKYERLGIEPSDAAEVANISGINTIQDFFGKEGFEKIKTKYDNFDIITATNVFAHMPNPKENLELISQLLHDEGIFVSENHYLSELITKNQFDTIYHEHLRYYHLGSLINYFAFSNLEIFHVEMIETHGGSIRVYSAKKGKFKRRDSVKQLLKLEEEIGVDDGSWIESFRNNIVQAKIDFYGLISKLQTSTFYGVGAPSRSATLLNYFGLDSNIMPFILEHPDSPKVGSYFPGTSIRVISENDPRIDKSTPLVFLSWHIFQELSEKFSKMKFTGNFISPLPNPKLLI